MALKLIGIPFLIMVFISNHVPFLVWKTSSRKASCECDQLLLMLQFKMH
jgi:hypothetical protein